MIEKIFDRGTDPSSEPKLLSIIIRREYNASGIKFFTPDDFFQQLGYMNRERGYMISPHVHNLVNRNVDYTQEVLVVKSGKVRVDYYNDEKIYLESRILYQGDVVLLAAGGHGFRMLENCEMIEVKQGPYVEQEDKILFPSVDEDKITITPS